MDHDGQNERTTDIEAKTSEIELGFEYAFVCFFKSKVGLLLNTFDMNFFGIIYSKYVVWA